MSSAISGMKQMTTQDEEYVCQVYWPPVKTDAGYYKVFCVLSALLVKLLCGMVGCHFEAGGYELHDLRMIKGASLITPDDECTHVELIFVDCVAIEDNNA